MGLVSLTGTSAGPPPAGSTAGLDEVVAKAIDAILALRVAVGRCSGTPEERALLRTVADEAADLERFVREAAGELPSGVGMRTPERLGA